VAVNPTDPTNVIVGQNDSRIGYNHCGFDYSLDGGSHFGDGIPPFFQHTNPGTGHTYDAASDPAVTFTGTGRAWYSCVVFDINSNASAVFATRSTPALKGSAYANIPDAPSPLVVAETNDGHTFYDKEFIAGDTRASHEEVYETFTVFVADQKCSKGNNPGAFCSSEIWYSKWDPVAGKFTPIANLSGSSSSLCVLGDFFDKKADPNACNFNQGSMPVVLPTRTSFGTMATRRSGRRTRRSVASSIRTGRWDRSRASARTTGAIRRCAISGAARRSASTRSTSGRTTIRRSPSIRRTPTTS
jgi:hypothetical protein